MTPHAVPTRRKRTPPRLTAWLASQGAEILPAKLHERVRFQANGVLCIIYEKNRKGRTSCVPQLAQDALTAFEEGRSINLTNEAADILPIEDWHAVGRAICTVAARVKAGEPVDVAHEASALSITPDRLARALAAHGAGGSQNG